MDAESSSPLVALRMPQGYEWHIQLRSSTAHSTVVFPAACERG